MSQKSASRRIVFVQYGDYAEAVYRFARGGKENYYAQRYTVDYVAELAATHGSATVVTLSCDRRCDKLPNGVDSQGILLYPPGGRPRMPELLKILERLKPTDLVVVTPIREVLHWAMARGIRVLPLFADSFRAPGLLNKFRHFLLRRTLNRREIRWVANHSIAASQDLARIGVRPDKVLPFDWPPLISPSAFKPRQAPDRPLFRLLYVGALLESKGVGDVIRAMPLLPACTLTVVGAGNDELDLRALATVSGISDRVDFRGKISHEEVLDEMLSHHAVLVPSRPQYPEGLPMVIYEAFCTRTPVVASDHPMFLKRLDPDINALIFPAGNSFSIARAVERLRTSPRLYRALSEKAGKAAENYLLPLKWKMLLDLWLQDTPEAETRLASFSLTKRRYA